MYLIHYIFVIKEIHENPEKFASYIHLFEYLENYVDSLNSYKQN